MKPEVASACYSIEQAYKHPEIFTPQEIIDLWEEYCLGLYMNKFTFIYCLRKPVYMAISKVHEDTLILFGGRYRIESAKNNYYSEDNKLVFDLDTETYPFGDSRPFYKGNGNVIDFTDSTVKGIIICSEKDYTDKKWETI